MIVPRLLLSALFAVCAFASSLGEVPELHVAGVPNIYLAGDSTLSPRKAEQTNGSWGDELRPFLRKNVEIFNHAVAGRSTKTFLGQGDWERMFRHMDLGDFVFIQFGHNDQNLSATNKCTTLDEYAANLKRMVGNVRAKGAKPVLITPIARRYFGGNGKLRPDRQLGDYADRMKTVAAELGVPLVDMRRLTREAVDATGYEASLAWYMASVDPSAEHKDYVHPTKAGAKVFADLFLKDVRAHQPELAALFTEKPELPRMPPVVRDGRKRTPEAAAFFRNLKRLGREGKTVASWLEPWEGEHKQYGFAPGLAGLAEALGNGTYRSIPVVKAELPDVYVKTLTGEDPLIYYLDFNRITGTYYGKEHYNRTRAAYETLVRKAYAKWHSVPVFSWHPENPYTPNEYHHAEVHGTGSMYRFRYVSRDYPQEHRFVIREILDGTGGPCGDGRSVNMRRFLEHPDTERPAYPNPRAWFEERLDEIADFIGRLKDERGRPIPLVVRLWHECEDDWSWWQRGSVTRDDYVKFFRYTVEGIRRRTGGGKQLLFLYSPDRHWDTLCDADSKRDFMYRYPGDEYVDIIGYDDYSIGKPDKDKDGKFKSDRPDLREFLEKRLEVTIDKMRLITAEAAKRGKACGLIETGYKGAVDDGYDYLLRALNAPGVGFSLVNTWGGSTVPPTPAGVECFKRYLADPRILTVRDGVDLVK